MAQDQVYFPEASMSKYTVTVKMSFVQEMEILADDADDARRMAVLMFDPNDAEVFSVDVYGVDLWDDNREDYEYETARQKEIDDEA